MRTFFEFLSGEGNEAKDLLSEKNWIQGAIKHPGRCTPITKPGCTGHAKALAKRFKHGDLHKHIAIKKPSSNLDFEEGVVIANRG